MIERNPGPASRATTDPAPQDDGGPEILPDRPGPTGRAREAFRAGCVRIGAAYRALPDWAQPIAWGLGVATPIALLIVVARWPDSPPAPIAPVVVVTSRPAPAPVPAPPIPTPAPAKVPAPPLPPTAVASAPVADPEPTPAGHVSPFGPITHMLGASLFPPSASDRPDRDYDAIRASSRAIYHADVTPEIRDEMWRQHNQRFGMTDPDASPEALNSPPRHLRDVPGPVEVDGYRRKDGTYVRPYRRRR